MVDRTQLPEHVVHALDGLALKYSELYRALRVARRERIALQAQEETLHDQLKALQSAAGVFGFTLQKPPRASEVDQTTIQPAPAPADQPSLPNLDGRPTIREIVLGRLQAAGDEGSKAAPIRDFLEREHGIKTHEKTVGMTLYRLLKAGLARRNGTTWFFDPTGSEKKNPGAPTPGQNGVFD